jgi:uncharacterized membrane protein YgdD (TMEM256/DUF423 family)
VTPVGSANADGASQGVRAALVAWAGLSGAAGVALAAIAAHKVESPALVAASTMLLVHAVAAVALMALTSAPARLRLAAAGVMLFAASLFGSDVTLHTLTGSHLFPMAAPTGGSLLIASWLFVAGIGLCGLRRV